MYITKEMDMVNNIESVYAKICGQCTEPLQNMIKHLSGFTTKHKEKDGIWHLKNLKTVSTGIDFLGNKRVNYFNALKYFLNMRQGPLEGDGGYIQRSISTIETLILSGGRHVLCSPDITESAY